MALDSEAIWQAIWQRLYDETTGFTKVTRKRADWPLESHPVLMVLDDSGDEVLLSPPDDPSPVWRITGELIILARAKQTTEQDDEPTTSVNALKQSVIAALEMKSTDPVHGQLAHYWDVNGLVAGLSVTKVSKGAGQLTGQAVVQISLEMETNAP